MYKLDIKIKTEWPATSANFSESQRPMACQDIPSSIKDMLLFLVHSPPNPLGRTDAC